MGAMNTRGKSKLNASTPDFLHQQKGKQKKMMDKNDEQFHFFYS